MIINNNDSPDVSRLSLGADPAIVAAPPAPLRLPDPPPPTPRQGMILSRSQNSPNLVQQALASSSSARSARVQELKALCKAINTSLTRRKSAER